MTIPLYGVQLYFNDDSTHIQPLTGQKKKEGMSCKLYQYLVPDGTKVKKEEMS